MRKAKQAIRYTTADKVFLSLNYTVLTVFLLILAYPLLFVISAAFSGGNATMTLNLWPKTPTLAGFRAVFEYKAIWTGYLNSLIYMATGTLLSLTITVLCAYPLSRSNFRFGGVIMGMCVFTMYFSGGMIPGYLNIRNLGVLDTIWALIVPGSLSVYNMIVVRTYFKTSIPGELLEAAQLDGCGDGRYLVQIVLPLSVPVLAVITLYCAVNQWNSYFGPMIYLSTRSKFPLSMILRDILIANTIDLTSLSGMDPTEMADLQAMQNLMKYAVIIVASIPVMVLYPFVQRYFVKGVMLGAIKG